jgi:hypothetical protein
MRITGIVLLGLILAGCQAAADREGAASADADAGGRGQGDERRNEHSSGRDRDREVVESDLYKLVGDQLYVYNYSQGLSVIDVSREGAPSIRAHESVYGPAGEIYVDGDSIFLLLETASTACRSLDGMALAYEPSELVILRDEGESFSITSRICLAGQLIATRLLGDTLYVVANDPVRHDSSVMSIDVSRPSTPELLDYTALPGDSREIHLGDEALFVVQEIIDSSTYHVSTRITHFDISRLDGSILERGAVDLEGVPQGRFHMDATSDTFRIVTYDWYSQQSLLHVLDISDAAGPVLLGRLGIGAGEQLFAARFVDDRAYVVTFLQTDPLWVVDLSSPSHPEIIGELWVPGFSDFIFPRGDRLLTVGRGASFGVGVALFDVSDPTDPWQVDAVELGSWDGGSEANIDYRGLGIIEPGELGASGLVAIPTAVRYGQECENTLHLIDLSSSGLAVRGGVVAEGAIRRSLRVGERLYVISDLEVASIDVADRDAPTIDERLAIGNVATIDDPCAAATFGPDMWMDDMWVDDYMYWGCRAGGPVGGFEVVVLVAFAVLRRRRAMPGAGVRGAARATSRS